MGNQLAAIAPAQIFPVETYLHDLGEQVTYENSLSSTRFLKVARARTKDGLMTVKVFVVHDPSLPLQGHEQKLKELLHILSDTKHCLPYHIIAHSDKAAIFGREYLRYTLCERVVSRPFLTWTEKLWFAYQLLQGLRELHERGICHGDLRTENCLVASSGWLCVTDIASFKPALLPVDNPTDFTYFFDMSGKRKCCIAPERFVPSLHLSSALPQSSASTSPSGGHDSLSTTSLLTPAMDIFSAGCVLTELFTDAKPPFDFAQLLQFRAGEYTPSDVLQDIPDDSARELVSMMLSKSPALRPTASEALDSDIFPLSFKEALWPWAVRELRESTCSTLQLDDHVLRLQEQLIVGDRKDIDCQEAEVLSSRSILPIPLTFLCACVRGLKFTVAKEAALNLLSHFAERGGPSIFIDRILPFVLHFLADQHPPSVKAKAIVTLTQQLEKIPNKNTETVASSTSSPRLKSGIDVEAFISSPSEISSLPETRYLFPDLIFPELIALAAHPSLLVRATLAEHLGTLSLCAKRFASNSSDHSWLVSWVTERVCVLFSDATPAVRIGLLDKSLPKLMVFFGRQRANDVLLSHMITFLNDKLSAPVRRAFYRAVVGLAVFTGMASAEKILKPLLLQGLSDAEESVVVESINAAASLAELGLIPKDVLVKMLSETAPLLAAPNPWIRRSITELFYVASTTGSFTMVESYAWINPISLPYLKTALGTLDDPLIFLNTLDAECRIPRLCWDALLRSETLLQEARDEDKLKTLLLKFCGTQDRAARVRESVIRLRETLLKVQRHRKTLNALLWGGSENSARKASRSSSALDRPKHSPSPTRSLLDLASCTGGSLAIKESKHLRSVDVSNRGTHSQHTMSSGINSGPVQEDGSGAAYGYYRQNANASMNQEWVSMFGADMAQLNKQKSVSEGQNNMLLGAGTLVPSFYGTAKQSPAHSPSLARKETGSPVALSSSPSPAGISVPGHLVKVPLSESPSLSPATSVSSDGKSVTLLSATLGRPSSTGSAYASTSNGNNNAFVEYQCTPCRSNFQSILRKRVSALENLNSGGPGRKDVSYGGVSAVAPAWDKIRGKPLLHMHPHSAAVTQLIRLPGTLFASASKDGTVKLWDTARIEGASMINRPVGSVTVGGAIVALLWLPALAALCVGVSTGRIYLFRIEISSRGAVFRSLQLPSSEPIEDCYFVKPFLEMEFPLVHILPLNQGRNLLLVSAWGNIFVYDVRTPGGELKESSMKHHLRNGVPTASVLADSETWFTLGSSSGYMSLWDLRFHLPVTSVQHPGRLRVRTLALDPDVDGGVIAAFQGNNEVSIWSMETQSRKLTFWFSPQPLLSWQQVNHHYTSALFAAPSGKGSSKTILFTGGTDLKIRSLDIRSPCSSAIISSPGFESFGSQASGQQNTVSTNAVYKTRIVDGTEVVVEYEPQTHRSSPSSNTVEELGSFLHTPVGHTDTISAILGVVTPATSTPLLVTGACDGVVKIWR